MSQDAHTPTIPPEALDHFEIEDEYCPNCGGEGWVANCFEEFACVDPESGCDDCMVRCDWCRPRSKARQEDAP